MLLLSLVLVVLVVLLSVGGVSGVGGGRRILPNGTCLIPHSPPTFAFGQYQVLFNRATEHLDIPYL